MSVDKQNRKTIKRFSALLLRPATFSITQDQPSPDSTDSLESENASKASKSSKLRKLGKKATRQMYENNPFRNQPRQPNPTFAPLPPLPNHQAPPPQAGYYDQTYAQNSGLLQIPNSIRPGQQRQRSASSSNVPTINHPLLKPHSAPIARHAPHKSHSDLTQLYNTQNGQPSSSRHASSADHPATRGTDNRTGAIVNAPPPTIPNAAVEPAYNYVTADGQPLTAATQKKKKGLFSSAKSHHKNNLKAVGPAAWIAGHAEKFPYDLALLVSGVKVPELWNENGDVLVYLFPVGTRQGPSFRINSSVLASSAPLRASAVALNTSGSNDTRYQTQSLLELRIPTELDNPMANPLSPADIQKLVRARNLIAFLVGQSLIATPSRPTLFNVFYSIADLLDNFGFTDGPDGINFGEVADKSFTMYITELGMLDVRNNCEKMVEGLLLGERMKSATMWNEAFVHSVGQYPEIQQQCPAKFAALSQLAIQRLERARMDLEKRTLRIQDRLSDFDFPSVFSGLLNSRTAEVREVTRFEAWKSAFLAMRKFFISDLKQKHGSWPPKKTNKNSSVPALNRRVLKDLGYNLAMLYDLMVDRKHPSSRLKIFGKQFPAHPDRRIEALRKVLQEYDFSGIPVYPTMPFDAPLLPRLSDHDGDHSDSEKKPKKVGKNELQFILVNSYNKDTYGANLPFIQQWHAFEQKSTSGMTIDRIVDFRLGAWLFIHCVIQSLPMVTVDAPGIKFSEGVEYFLCEPPRGRLHWSSESLQYEWYRDPVTGNLLQMAKDVLELSDDAIYRMSHCWKMGELWEQQLTVMPGAKPVTPPRGSSESASGRNQSLPTTRASPHQRGASRGGASNSPSSQHSPALHPHHFSPPTLQNPNWGHNTPGFRQSSSSFQSIPSLESADTAMNDHGTPSLQSLLSIPTPPPIIEDPAGVPSDSRRYSASRSRNSSPYTHGGGPGKRESVLMMGLERVPVPIHGGPPSAGGTSPRIPIEADTSASGNRSRKPVRVSSMTFDGILASAEADASSEVTAKKQRGRSLSRTLLGSGGI